MTARPTEAIGRSTRAVQDYVTWLEARLQLTLETVGTMTKGNPEKDGNTSFRLTPDVDRVLLPDDTTIQFRVPIPADRFKLDAEIDVRVDRLIWHEPVLVVSSNTAIRITPQASNRVFIAGHPR